MYWGIFFSSKHKAHELVATEHLSKCILLMECPRLVRVELNMLFALAALTRREQYITPIGVSSPSQPGLCEAPWGKKTPPSAVHVLKTPPTAARGCQLHIKQVSSDRLGVAFGC